MKHLVSILFVFILSCAGIAQQDLSLERGKVLLAGGAYKEAIAHFTAMLAKQQDEPEAQVLLLRAMSETGDYTNAEKKAKEFLAKAPTEAALRVALGTLQYETGRYAEAAVEFDRAAREGKGVPRYRALLNRALALKAQGKEEEAKAPLAALGEAYSDVSDEAGAEGLTIFARAFVLLEKYQDANDIFIDARDEDDQYAEAFIEQGNLLNEKYNYGEAASLFEDALKINANSPAALLGMAESKMMGAGGEALAHVDRALQVNPNSVRALVLKARLALEIEKSEEATKTADRALTINPNSVEARALRAAVFYLADKKPDLDAEAKRALAVNPKAGVFYDTLGHFAVNNRRYADAVEFYRKAVDLSPNLWSARTQLGVQLLRVGKTPEGKAELEKTFEGDPFNIWAKNTLDLLDSIADYTDTVRGPFVIKTSPKETGVVAPYAADLIEEAHKKLTAKYKFTPKSPIAVELFENHDDFAVKALGLPGLGALGVCFGQTISMDGPSARETGEFNWGSTLWHEYMHVVSLQITDYKIPRWFSEGLSVYEERRARPGWGDDWSLDTIKAYMDGRFVKIADLDAAFTRPKTPDGVGIAYFQASQVCEFVEEKHGFDAILKMLAFYKEGLKDTDVLQRALQLTPEKFDQAFAEFIKSKVGGYVEALGTGPVKTSEDAKKARAELEAAIQARPNHFFALLRLGTIAKAEGETDLAIDYLKRAAKAFPFYASEGNPYTLLADLYEAKKAPAEAITALEQVVKYNENDVDSYKRLARLRLGANDKSGALNLILTSFYISPFDSDLHKLAGDAYLEGNSPAEAAREFRVVVALGPPDLAGAHYDLARALEASGDKKEAKRSILRSLEIAPNFDKALELLLKIRGE